MKPTWIVAVAVAIGAAGCAQTVQYRYLSTEVLRNDAGHVVGHRDVLMDPIEGKELEQITYYSPVLDAKGNIVAYEEPIRGGMLIRSLEGRRVGTRYPDLRSRGSNPGNDGLTITFRPRQD